MRVRGRALGDRAAARARLRGAAGREPDGWSHLNNFGLFELEGGDARAAARLFEQAVELNASNQTGYRGLLEAAKALGDARRLARAESGLARLSAR